MSPTLNTPDLGVLIFWGVPRTLLALGCHVGMADEKAEENLKKIKLPKTWVWGGWEGFGAGDPSLGTLIKGSQFGGLCRGLPV